MRALAVCVYFIHAELLHGVMWKSGPGMCEWVQPALECEILSLQHPLFLSLSSAVTQRAHARSAGRL